MRRRDCLAGLLPVGVLADRDDRERDITGQGICAGAAKPWIYANLD